MKLYKLFFLNVLILLMIFVGSCAKSSQLQGPSPSETTLLKPGSTAIYTPPVLATMKPSVITMTPTFTYFYTRTTTNSPIPTNTHTVVPTLSVENADLKLLDLLSNNGNCTLPCLWGIIPGNSKFMDAQIILEPLSSISELTHFSSTSGTIYLRYNIDELIISTNISYLTYPDNETINRITFEARALKEIIGENTVMDVFDSNVYGEQLSLYMLPQILSDYGSPFSVFLSTLAEVPDPRYGQGHFKIILIYPDQGILVSYTTDMRVFGKNVIGCPSNAHVKIELYPSGQGDNFLNNLDPSLQEDIKNNYKPLDEVTSLNMADFYQIFSQHTNKCLETPTNLWPIPEK